MAGQVVVVGYGSKGRAVIRALSESGVQKAAIVVIDSSAEAVAEVNAAGLVAVGGDATRSEVLRQAQIGSAGRVVIAVGRHDTAVLVALTGRQLNPSATIVAAVREEESRTCCARAAPTTWWCPRMPLGTCSPFPLSGRPRRR